MKLTPVFLASLLFTGVTALAGQRDRVIDVRRAEYVPPLTGTLTNPIWRDASVFTNFQVVSAEAGKKPSQRMSVYLMYDNDNVYAALRMDDKQKDSIRANAKSADEVEKGDWGAIYLDNQYFQVSPTGIQANGMIGPGGKRSPEPLKSWTVSARKVPTGWIAEISIPFSTLGVTKNEVVMGFKAVRFLARSSELAEGPVTQSGQEQKVRFTAKKPSQF